MLEPTKYDFGCKGTPTEAHETTASMRDDHHVTDTEDVAFDRTMAIVLIVIAGLALWYVA